MPMPDSQRYPETLIQVEKYFIQIIFPLFLKGSDRLDMLVELRVHYCRELFNNSFETYNWRFYGG